MVVQALTVVLLVLWIVLGALGIAFLMRRRWLLGCMLLGEAVLAAGAQIALSTIPVGIGEPIIRISQRALLLCGGIAAVIGLILAAAVIVRRQQLSLSLAGRWKAIALALCVPVVAAASLWGLSYISTPERERERDPNKRSISLIPGFAASIYAQGTIDNPTSITFGPDGKLYIADIAGTLWVATDENGDHVVDKITKWADGFSLLLGMVWHKDELFVSSSGKVEALRDTNGDGVADARRTVADGLPALIFRPHSNNSLTLGPDGRLYFGVGSTSDNGPEKYPLASAILSVSPDGGDVKVYARGFGNPFEVAFNARGDLFTGDNNGLASPDGNPPPDEFNQVVEGGDYNDTDPLNTIARPPLISLPPHSTPTGLTFYTGRTYPQEYFDNAFLALWNQGEVVRIQLEQDARGGNNVGNSAGNSAGDYGAKVTTFGNGFLYPIDVLTGPDGNLYIADFGTSVIYRITYDADGIK